MSRVGGAAQIKAMKPVSGTLKLDLAQFRELEAFATFGSELDKVSQAQLDRGYRLTELLKQPQNEPVPVEEQVLVIYAGTKGWADTVPVSEVRRFETELREYFRANHPACSRPIRTTGALPDGRRARPRPDHVPRGLRHREGRLTDGRRPGAHPAAADPHACSPRRRSPRRWSSSPPRRSCGPRTGSPPTAPTATAWPGSCGSRRPGDPAAAAKLLGTPEAPQHVGILAIVGDRGLSGSYNSACCGPPSGWWPSYQAAGVEVTVWSVGKKAPSYFRFRGIADGGLLRRHSPTGPTSPTPARWPPWWPRRSWPARWTRCSWSPPGSSRPGPSASSSCQLLPLPAPRGRRGGGRPTTRTAVEGYTEFEPDGREAAEQLAPRALESEIFAALLEGAASFFTAQQRAMAAATDNADELVRTLSRVMNRARQDAITTEIMEIVGGAEALRQSKGA